MRPGRRRLRAALAAWLNRARPEQLLPPGAWYVWLLMTGRGFGKTRTGAEAVAIRMVNRPGLRVALVAQTFADGRDVMVEGESGLLEVLRRYYGDDVDRWWNRSMGELQLPNGSRAKVYSAERPRQLRGPQHHLAWCDELAWWQYPRATWDALVFGLRLGDHPQVIVTTSPRPVALLKELVDADDTTLTTGSTLDNAANLPASVVQRLVAQYAGTRTGDQELDGVLMMEAEGARWTRALQLVACQRVVLPELDRVVVGVDPAVTSGEDADATGYAVLGRGPAPESWAPPPALLERMRATVPGGSLELARIACAALPHLYVLHTAAERVTPSDAMGEAADLVQLWDARHVVIEANNGGEYLPTVLVQVAPGTRWRIVTAKGKKLARAEPFAQLYDQHRVHHVGRQELLEDEQVSYTGAPREPSPNVLDAAVHAATDLLPPIAPGHRPRQRKPAKLVRS